MSSCCKNDLIVIKNPNNSDCCNNPENMKMKTKHYQGFANTNFSEVTPKKYYFRLEDKRKYENINRYINNNCCNSNNITNLKLRNSSSRSMMNMKVTLNNCSKPGCNI